MITVIIASGSWELNNGFKNGGACQMGSLLSFFGNTLIPMIATGKTRQEENA
jgi:hypothetical protein